MEYDFNHNLKINIFGTSHSKEIGVSITGLPSDFIVDTTELASFIKRRAPTSFSLATKRNENDVFTIISTAPFTAIIKNQDVHSGNYEEGVLRPSHADFTAKMKYGMNYDTKGGSIFSGRMTAPFCIAGGICKQILAKQNIFIGGHIFSIGNIKDTPFDMADISKEDIINVTSKTPSIINDTKAKKMQALINSTRNSGDSIGGIIECAVIGLPAGIGGPLFSGIEGMIAQTVFAIPGVKGIEFGSGFTGSSQTGSINNDSFYINNNTIKTVTNNHGGILGGISSGMPIVFRTAFKPTPSIAKEQKTVNINTMTDTTICIKGRHDPCIALRAVPIVESAAAIAILDIILGSQNA